MPLAYQVPDAVQVARNNCERNDVDAARVVFEEGDACMLMYKHRDDLNRYI